MPAFQPMMARDLGGEVCLTAPRPFAGISQYLTDAYAIEPKWDGVRVHVTFGDKANRILSARHGLVITDNLPHLRDAVIPGMAGLTLDGELIANGEGTDQMLSSTSALLAMCVRKAVEVQRFDGPARFFAFDLLHDGSEDITALPYDKRRAMMLTVVGFWQTIYPNLPVQSTPQWPATAASIKMAMRQGHEGVVIKRRDSAYLPGERGHGWYKVKTVSTGEAFVTGWRPGENGNRNLVGSLAISVYRDGVPVEIGHVGNMTVRFRREITAPDGSLLPEWYDRVLEFAAQGLSKDFRLRSPRLLHMRPDQAKADCTADNLAHFPRV